MQAIEIRRLAPSDSLDDLTSMLHRAFAPLGHMGLACTAVSQSTETTAQRVRRGECYVAVCGGRLVGTLTLHSPDRRSACRWYRQPDVASLHQFAVDPQHQGTGCGGALLLAAARWAEEHDYAELALDTPAAATHLVQFYQRQGFRVVDQVQMAGRAYCSAVLSKPVNAMAATGRRPPHTVHRPSHAPLFGAMVGR